MTWSASSGAAPPSPVAATQFSQAQTALQGGDLGWVRKEEVDPEVAAVIERMPPGAISNAIRVPGGFQIVGAAAAAGIRPRHGDHDQHAAGLFPFAGTLDPNNPTQQQRDQVEKAQRLAAKAPAAARRWSRRPAAAAATGRPIPAPIRLETVTPPPLRACWPA